MDSFNHLRRGIWKEEFEGEEETMQQSFLHKGREGSLAERTEHRASSVMQGPPSPDVTKASGSLPARKIGLVTVLSPNGHTL